MVRSRNIDGMLPTLPPLTTPFLIMALLVELTPGPNMTYLALVSASHGRKAGWATVAGVALGLTVIGIVAALGVAELIRSSALLYEILRWSGVIFLLYLAWEGWFSGADVAAGASSANGRYFSRGLVANLLNPKAGVFYISVLPTFIDPTMSPARQAIVLTVIYVAVATSIHSIIVLLAGSLQQFLNDPNRERMSRRFLSLLLATVALWFAWTTGR